MLSIERCREILKTNNLNLNNEEIKQVRDYLYFLLTCRQKPIIITKLIQKNDDKCIYL